MLRFLGTKIGISIIAAILIIGGATYIKYRKAPSADTLSSKVGVIAQESIQNALKNGQLDNAEWEKALEAIQGTTTLDEKIAVLSETGSKSDEPAAPLTATDRFAQAFLTEYARLKKTGAQIDENTTVRLVNDLLAQDYGSAPLEKVYTASNIYILSDSSISGIRKYANLLGAAFDQPMPTGYENEVAILDRVYQTDNTEDLDKLAQNIARYVAIRSAIAQTAVPNSLSQAHIALLNSLSAIIEGVRGMQLVSTDPVGATKMILRYEDGLKAIDLSIHEITTYLKRHSITFSSSESGYIFME
jgi:hypothetical protein